MTTALTVQQQALTPYSDALRPRSLDEAMRLADMLSKSDMVPKDYRGKPGNIVAAVQMGAELGLAPMQSLQNIAVINGRPSVWGDALLALVQAHPACEWVRERLEGEGDARVAVCEIQRRGNPEPTRSTFSIADAKRAQLWGKQGPWSQYPERMLKMRARGFAARDAFADALKGLASAEEAQDIPPQRAEVIHEATPEQRPAQSSVSAAKAKLAAKRPQPEQQGPDIGDVLEMIASASDEGSLKLAGEAAKVLEPAQQEEARAAYKARAQRLREDAFRAKQRKTDDDHDFGPPPMDQDSIPEEFRDPPADIVHRAESAPYRVRGK